MCRLKRWLVKTYMPAYAKEAAAEQEEFYQKKIRELQRENDRLKAYAAGLEQGLKSMRRINIYNNGGE